MKTLATAVVLIFAACCAVNINSQTIDDDTDIFWLKKKFRPSVEFSYGISDAKLSTSPYSISDAGMFELRLGFDSKARSGYSPNLVMFRSSYLAISNASYKFLSKDPADDELKNSLWRFGTVIREGTGFDLGQVKILPYNSTSFMWSEFSYENNTINGDSITGTVNDFNESFRFGTGADAGIAIEFIKGVSIFSAYEFSHIFPRHLFAKQFTSSVIEFTGMELIDSFARLIMKSAPEAGAITNFILKSAYEYGFYQLRKEQMNWPFTSTSPMRYSTFRAGVNLVF